MSVKEQVMQKIKQENIEMRPAYFFWLKKIGLQSLLAFFIVLGALLGSGILYLIKRMQLLGGLSFGWTGLERFLVSLPYDYIALFIITIALANVIIRQFDMSYDISMNTRMSVLLLLVMTLLLSAFFLINGIGDMLKVWDKNKVLEGSVGAQARGNQMIDFQVKED